MQFKKIVWCFTMVISLLSLYYLSFSWLDYRIQRQADRQAMDEVGRVDFDRRQAYLVDLWKKPVYQWLGISYTYEEIKERSFKWGLDLQGGMHVVMELLPAELVQALASYNRDPAFLEALAWATYRYKRELGSFAKLFISAYKRLAPEADLQALFAAAIHQEQFDSFSEQDVIHFIDQKIAAALDRSLTIIRARLDRFGASQPIVQRLPGSNRIQIELPGITNAERVRKLLQGVARLRFWEVAEEAAYAAQLEAVDRFLCDEERASLESIAPVGEQGKAPSPPTQSLLKRLGKGRFPYYLAYATQDRDRIEAMLCRQEVKALLPHSISWMWAQQEQILSDGTAVVTLYPIKQSNGRKPLLEGDIVVGATQQFAEGKPIVTMSMNRQGASLWRNITASHIGKRIAIALDDRIYSAPVVQQEIPNGYSSISGHFTLEEAKDLASVLQTGSLPAPLAIVEEVIIGPMLGKIAQNQGLIAIALGLGSVLLFMFLYYAKAGLIANGALLVNLLFIAGILVQLDATLTLPGIAGLVLTIGMSIDANVLIFERVREELRKKMPIKEAIRRGYDRSYGSILDSNITTLLAGLILYYFGQGQIRGFAIVLMVGVVSSVFSSVCVTQLLFSCIKRGYCSFYGVIPKLFENIKVNFVARRGFFYLFSLCFIAMGAYAFYYKKGLSVGVDFAGGRAYVVHLAKPIDPSLLQDGLSTSFKEAVTVRTYGADNIMQITTSYLSDEDTLAVDEQVKDKLSMALQDCLRCCKAYRGVVVSEGSQDFYIASSSKVDATVARDIQKSAKQALLLALLNIFLYVALRFRKWRFGMAAVVALMHDALAVVAGFCIARLFGFTYEVNEVFLAAVLTVIGYSINDTVVIFDRIREKIAVGVVSNVVIDEAIGETLSRTIITSFTTLLAVSILFFFGGEALRGFSFALLLGILFGTYSSICIAAPLLADFRGSSSPVNDRDKT